MRRAANTAPRVTGGEIFRLVSVAIPEKGKGGEGERRHALRESRRVQILMALEKRRWKLKHLKQKRSSPKNTPEAFFGGV